MVEVYDLIEYIVLFWRLLMLASLLYFVVLVIRYRKTLDSAGSQAPNGSERKAMDGAAAVTMKVHADAGFADRGRQNSLMTPARYMS